MRNNKAFVILFQLPPLALFSEGRMEWLWRWRIRRQMPYWVSFTVSEGLGTTLLRTLSGFYCPITLFYSNGNTSLEHEEPGSLTLKVIRGSCCYQCGGWNHDGWRWWETLRRAEGRVQEQREKGPVWADRRNQGWAGDPTCTHWRGS